MKMKKVRLAKGGARLATEAERNSIARNIVAKTNAWAKKSIRGL